MQLLPYFIDFSAFLISIDPVWIYWMIIHKRYSKTISTAVDKEDFGKIDISSILNSEITVKINFNFLKLSLNIF